MLSADDEHLIEGLGPSERAGGGLPEPAVVERRALAHAAVCRRLAALGASTSAVRVSPLGPAWSGDIDLHLSPLPDAAAVAAWGWLSLDRLLERLGSRGAGRWAVREDGHVLGVVDVHAFPAPDPVDAVLLRCRRRGQVRLREVLELRSLVRSGAQLPARDVVVSAAADAEAWLGGTALGAWSSGVPRAAPVELEAGRVRRRARQLARRLLGHRRVVVAVSGVDGAGKSTLAASLLADLSAAGVPSAPVWTRPGMGLGRLSTLAARVKKATGQSAEPGVRAMASGDRPAPRSRRGLLGWAWTMAVTTTFVVTSRREHRRGRGVLVYDRHLLDALATLHVLYRGVPLGLPSALVHRLLPRADLTLYLRLPPEVAHARKPDDPIGAYAVRAQVEEYERMLPLARRLHVLDATRPPAELAAHALEIVLRLP